METIGERLRETAASCATVKKEHDVHGTLSAIGVEAAEAADTIDVLVAAAEKALYEMRHTIAPLNSFTDAVDALDAALTLACGKE